MRKSSQKRPVLRSTDRPVLRSTDPDVTIRQELGGTVYGLRGRTSPHLLALLEGTRFDDPQERELAEIAGLVPRRPTVESVAALPQPMPTGPAPGAPSLPSLPGELDQAQWDLWEQQFRDEQGIDIGSAFVKAPKLGTKEKLRQYYLTLLLPALEARAPVWWKVLSLLHEKSPADLSWFELGSRELARVAGVGKGRVSEAIDHLHELGLIEMKKGFFKDGKPKEGVRPRYRLVARA